MRTFAAAGFDVKVPLHGHFAPAAAAAAAASSSLPLSKCQRASCPFAAHSQAPPQMRGYLKVTLHMSHFTCHTSHVLGHCCVACLQNAGSHGPACQQTMWRSSLTSAAAAAPARAAAVPVSSSQAPSAAAGGEVELVLECAAAMRLGAVGDVNPLQVCVMIMLVVALVVVMIML